MLALASALLAAPAGAAPPPPESDLPGAVTIVDAAGAPLTWEAALARMADADVVILGEVHDNPFHHEIQAWATTALAGSSGGVTGLAFEMFWETAEDDVNRLRAEGAPRDALAGALDWAESGWGPFDFYAPILEAAPEAYVAGGALPRADLMQVAREGPQVAPDAVRFGLDQPLDPAEQAEREAMQVAVHCDALPPDMAPMMVGAQRVRDARFAAAVVRAREAAPSPGRTILITGSGHARIDRGAPRYLRRVAPDLAIVAVGLTETTADLSDETAEDPAPAADPIPFDILITTPSRAEIRGDPCDVFREDKG